MVELVRAISAYAKARAPGFLIVPQNAPELGRRAYYLEAVDGVAQEGLYYGHDEEGAATDPAVTERPGGPPGPLYEGEQTGAGGGLCVLAGAGPRRHAPCEGPRVRLDRHFH